MVPNGHFSGEYQQTSLNGAGEPVFEMGSDYQSRANSGDGWMRPRTRFASKPIRRR